MCNYLPEPGWLNSCIIEILSDLATRLVICLLFSLCLASSDDPFNSESASEDLRSARRGLEDSFSRVVESTKLLDLDWPMTLLLRAGSQADCAAYETTSDCV